MQAFLFPGQGSQYVGMGKALFDTVKPYAEVEGAIDTLLGYSVREACLQGPESRLQDTRYTQPCLFIVNALCYYDALANGLRPAALAGHSLGEYNALMAGGAFDLLTGVRLVAKRGELMAAATDGAMAAVLKLPFGEVLRLLEDETLAGIDIANYNTPLQTVIAGPAAAIRRTSAVFERAGASYVPLTVSAAFHSRYMTDAAARFDRFLASFSFNALSVPVMANVTGRAYPEGNPTTTIRSFLVRQITKPVQWVHSIRHMRNLGVTSFKETGPGGVLMRLCQQIDEQDGAFALHPVRGK